MVVSTSFWSCLLNVSSVLTSLKYTATLFWVVMRCGYATIYGSTMFLILVCMFLKYVILCVYPLMRSFVAQFLFIFHDIVWLVKSSCSVHCCSCHQFYWVSDRCRSEFALLCFLSEKSCRHSTGSFSFFLVLIPRHSLSFHKFERQSCLFGVDNAFFLVNAT